MKTGPKSLAISLHPVASALIKAQKTAKWLGKSTFRHTNNGQKMFLDHLSSLVKDSKKIPEMKSLVSADPEKIKEFLGSNGKTKSTKITESDHEWYAAGMFEIFLTWKEKGEILNLKFDGKNVKGSYLKNCLVSKGMVSIETKSGDIAFMKIGKVDTELDLYSQVIDLMVSTPVKGAEKVDVHFPFVKLNLDSEFKWMKGLNLNPESGKGIDHPGYFVKRALTHNELDIDNTGARIKSSAVVTMRTKGLAPPKPKVVKIDSPFLFWVIRPGCDLPIFVAYVNTDSVVS
jgi:hypothetical protein